MTLGPPEHATANENRQRMEAFNDIGVTLGILPLAAGSWYAGRVSVRAILRRSNSMSKPTIYLVGTPTGEPFEMRSPILKQVSASARNPTFSSPRKIPGRTPGVARPESPDGNGC